MMVSRVGHVRVPMVIVVLWLLVVHWAVCVVHVFWRIVVVDSRHLIVFHEITLHMLETKLLSVIVLLKVHRQHECFAAVEGISIDGNAMLLKLFIVLIKYIFQIIV